MTLFWNQSERRLRAPWRLCLHALITVALACVPILLIAEPLTALHRRGWFLAGYGHDHYDRVINTMIGPLLTVAVVGGVAIAGRWLDHRPFSDFGAIIDRWWWKCLAVGFGVGMVVMTFVFFVERAAGWVTVTGFRVTNVADVSFAAGLLFIFTKVICVGIYEEFVSRGYHLRNLTESTNATFGIILSTLIFSLLHAFNENVSVVSLVGLFINGLLLAAAVILTGRLSTAIGIHIAWNLFEGMVFGFPVSGDKEVVSWLGITQSGPRLLSGGEFGPEAGLIGTIASLLGMGLLWVLFRRREATGE